MAEQLPIFSPTRSRAAMVSDSWASRSERSLLDDDDESMEGDTLTPMMRRASSSDSNSLSHAFARSGAASAEFSRQHAAGDFGRLASASLESVLEEEDLVHPCHYGAVVQPA